MRNSGSVLEIVESNENGYYSESLIDGNVNNFVKELLKTIIEYLSQP